MCSDLCDLCGLIACYRTLAKSHLSVVLMRWECMEMRSALCNVMEDKDSWMEYIHFR